MITWLMSVKVCDRLISGIKYITFSFCSELFYIII